MTDHMTPEQQAEDEARARHDLIAAETRASGMLYFVVPLERHALVVAYRAAVAASATAPLRARIEALETALRGAQSILNGVSSVLWARDSVDDPTGQALAVDVDRVRLLIIKPALAQPPAEPPPMEFENRRVRMVLGPLEGILRHELRHPHDPVVVVKIASVAVRTLLGLPPLSEPPVEQEERA